MGTRHSLQMIRIPISTSTSSFFSSFFLSFFFFFFFFFNSPKKYYGFLVRAVKTNSPAACVCTHKRTLTYSRYFIRDALLNLPVSDVGGGAQSERDRLWINTRCKSWRVSFNFEMGRTERGRKREKMRGKKRGEIKRVRKVGESEARRGRERRVARRRYVSFRYTTVLSASRTTYLLSLPTFNPPSGRNIFPNF